MSATVANSGDQPMSPFAPGSIRAALIGEEVADFDREYRCALADAAETLELTGVVDMLQRWQRVALSSQNEHAHRRMLDHAAQLNVDSEVDTYPWEQVKGRLGF